MKVIVGSSYVASRHRQFIERAARIIPTFNNRNMTIPLPVSVPFPWNREMITAMHDLDYMFDGFIADRQRSGPTGLDILSEALPSVSELGSSQFRDELIGLLLGAFESSYVSVSWALHLLATHPDWQERARTEVRVATQDEPPTGAALESTDILRRVLDETLRLYPPFPVTQARYAKDDTTILGRQVSCGSKIILSPWVTHRHPDYWKNPSAFDPDRFLEASSRERPRSAYFPFGDGPRTCVGRGLALVELTLVLACILQRLTFTPAADRPEPEVTGVPGRPSHGVWLRVQPA
jgi:cytochrome P450